VVPADGWGRGEDRPSFDQHPGQVAALAERLISETCAKQQISPGQLAIHADRGPSMTSKPVAFLLADPGVGVREEGGDCRAEFTTVGGTERGDDVAATFCPGGKTEAAVMTAG
jgi:hypothetical protein